MTTGQPITFVIADNQAITRAGIHGFISALPLRVQMEVIDVTDKKSLVNALMEHPESVVVLDYSLFDLRSVEEFLVLQKRFQGVKWIFFSSEMSVSLMRRLSFEDNVGMTLKECDVAVIRDALLSAADGEPVTCRQIETLLSNSSSHEPSAPTLTNSEIEILRLIAKGKSVKEIALERNSSVHTITTHKKNLFRKLEVNNVYEATKYAIRTGLVEMVEYYI